MSQETGGNIVIELGCGRDHVKGLGLNLAKELHTHISPSLVDPIEQKKAQLEGVSKSLTRALDEGNMSSSDNSLTYIYKTQCQSFLIREVVPEKAMVGKRESKKKDGKLNNFIKCHGMKTCKDRHLVSQVSLSQQGGAKK